MGYHVRLRYGNLSLVEGALKEQAGGNTIEKFADSLTCLCWRTGLVAPVKTVR